MTRELANSGPLAQRERRGPQRRKALTILSIEDNPADSLLINDELRAAMEDCPEVVLRDSLADGLAYLRNNRVDVVLLDLKLPDSDGFDPRIVIEAARPAPIVLITGTGSEQRLHELLALGAQDWLCKPNARAGELRRAVRGAITRARLAEERDRAVRTIIEASADAALIVDELGMIEFANRATEVVLGRPMEELTGRNFGLSLSIGDWIEVDVRRPDGSVRVVEMRVTQVDWQNRPAFHINLHDVTERRRNEKAVQQLLRKQEQLSAALAESNVMLERLALSDPLTGVLNRRGLFEAAAREIERSHRYQAGAALILFDLDHFKLINDRYGHETGDVVLQHVARSVKKIIRAYDIFGRYGGEEFALLLPDTTAVYAAVLAEKMRRSIADSRHAPSGAPPISASFGVVQLQPDENLEALMRRADELLYRAKHAGRNRVEV